MAVARKEQPHAIILNGPFLDGLEQQDIISGELYYQNPDQSKVYITHDDLFKDLIKTIQRELSGVKTKVIMIPSLKDIHHFEPLPQIPFNQMLFPGTNPTFVTASNPCTLQLNDLKISIINTDITKDMCLCLCTHNMT